ncbi:MAG: hypothetical protein WAO35_21210 [Terriglobia bacterium]
MASLARSAIGNPSVGRTFGRKSSIDNSLRAPRRKPQLGELRLWAVLAQEAEAPAGIKPLRWMLLTTCPVGSFEGACEKLHWYTLRWGIDVYLRTLKSGCQIEQRQPGSAARLEACLAIDLVVARRIYHLAKRGRETPQIPCTVYFEEAELKALLAYIHKPGASRPTAFAARSPAAGRQLGRLPGPQGRWPPRHPNPLARLAAPQRYHRHL